VAQARIAPEANIKPKREISMMNDDRHLDGLFSRYRAACPDPEASPEFMPKLWARIEGPRSFSFVFQRLGRLLLTSSAATCLLFVALNMAPHPAVPVTRTGYATYTDALSSTDNMLEHTYYSAESSPPVNSVPPEYEQ
jgi:hypothetical protein